MPFDFSNPSTWIPIVVGIVIPFVVAFLAKQHASGLVKSLIAMATAGLTALGLYLGNAAQTQTWKGAASAFILAIITAGATRTAVTGGADDKVAAKIPGGIG